MSDAIVVILCVLAISAIVYVAIWIASGVLLVEAIASLFRRRG